MPVYPGFSTKRRSPSSRVYSDGLWIRSLTNSDIVAIRGEAYVRPILRERSEAQKQRIPSCDSFDIMATMPKDPEVT